MTNKQTACKNILDIARDYVARGFSVFPLLPESKIPDGSALPIETDESGNPLYDNEGRIRHTWKPYQERYATDAELIKWFGNGSKRNIAIVTGRLSNLSVVDFDTAWAVKYAKANNFPKTPLAKTGKPIGYHAYYKYKEGTGNFQKRDDLPGIDLRSEGGYVVAPPSMHESGKRYEWVKGKGLDDFPLAELPEIILVKTSQYKTPIKELYSGVRQGDRNESLCRLTGSWAHDGLSREECLDMAHLWNEKNVPPLDRGEVERTVHSILEKHNREHARAVTHSIKSNPMTLIKLIDLFKEPDEAVAWTVENMLPSGGFSVLASKPKVGKSTIARNLAFSLARGESFLDRETSRGPVIYYALEEKRAEVKRHFRDMGAAGHEEIYIYAGAAPVDAILQIRAITEQIKPALIVIDPLFRLAKVKDGNDYVAVTAALEPLLQLARTTGAHVLCVHHTGKGDRQGGDSVLGSTAIFSSVDTLILIRQHDHYRTIQTRQRYGSDMEETTLNFDKEARVITVGKSRDEEEITSIQKTMLDFLTGQNDALIEPTIMEEVEGRTGIKRKALRELVRAGEVTRTGKGGKGDPFKYSCSVVPNILREQENENPENDISDCIETFYSRSEQNDQKEITGNMNSDSGNMNRGQKIYDIEPNEIEEVG
ncbi:MAG: AAA family ATPase [Dissulfurispiraceae bacterium]